MKKILLLTFILVSQYNFGQVTKDVGNFTKVTAFDKISVQLIESDENKVELKGKYENEAELVNNNGELKIRLPIGKFLDGEDLTVKVYFKEILAVEANEGSYLSCQSEIKSVGFDIIAKEGAVIKLNVNAQRIILKASQGAEVNLSGKAQNLDIVTNTGAKVKAETCKTEQTVVSVNAGGFADVYATDFVDAKTRAGGTITIYGNPKQVNQKTVLGGKIIISKR
ncbi:head GIN domain-containing protein [Flavobacterium sp.]|uniref:head GIN domain-containing protein n=1 Tax=Flavobacterium sp. TaxID=239 RepID=UPI00286A4093|nr:head GIN domain-containing protein [Flavobacterium sp.]